MCLGAASNTASCRTSGRMAEASGAQAVRVRLETTKRNTPARAFLESILPQQVTADARGLEGVVPAAVMAAVHFEPGATGEVVVEDDGGAKATPSARSTQVRCGGARSRSGEPRSALRSGAAVKAALDGRTPAVRRRHRVAQRRRGRRGPRCVRGGPATAGGRPLSKPTRSRRSDATRCGSSRSRSR